LVKAPATKVLEAEGVSFDEGGRADQSQRVSAEELAALIDTPEDEVLESEPALESV
jgi:hypothetical protein